MAETGKVRVEMEQRIQRLENEKRSKSELYDSISRLERDLSGFVLDPALQRILATQLTDVHVFT